jgi:hypothetical protein
MDDKDGGVIHQRDWPRILSNDVVGGQENCAFRVSLGDQTGLCIVAASGGRQSARDVIL